MGLSSISVVGNSLRLSARFRGGPSSVDRYEYTSILITPPDDAPINSLAAEGWRAVASTYRNDEQVWVLLERPRPQ
jgi:hypothetical protein